MPKTIVPKTIRATPILEQPKRTIHTAALVTTLASIRLPIADKRSRKGKGPGMNGKTSPDLNDNESPGDGAMADDLTEERDVTPEKRAEVADTQAQDP